MSAAIIDGKKLAAALREKVADAASSLPRPPGLAVILAGEDPASEIYVRNKLKAAREAGFFVQASRFPANISEKEMRQEITRLNQDPSVDGILLQLPLPPHLPRADLIASIAGEKDVDGLTPIQAGLLVQGHEQAVIPCTALGCLLLAQSTGTALRGANALVIGRSELAGRPLALLLLARDCTVTIAHSASRDLPSLARRADLLAVAAGRAEMVRGSWIKPGALVLDIGINRRGDKSLTGDVAFAEAVEVAGAITPVPGGAGPMTIACLLYNAYQLACRSQDRQRTLSALAAAG